MVLRKLLYGTPDDFGTKIWILIVLFVTKKYLSDKKWSVGFSFNFLKLLVLFFISKLFWSKNIKEGHYKCNAWLLFSSFFNCQYFNELFKKSSRYLTFF